MLLRYSTHSKNTLYLDFRGELWVAFCENPEDEWTRYIEISTYHYCDVIMSAVASQINGVAIACWTVCSGEVQRKYQSSASHWPLWCNPPGTGGFPHVRPATRKMFPFDDVIMIYTWLMCLDQCSIRTTITKKTDNFVFSHNFLKTNS